MGRAPACQVSGDDRAPAILGYVEKGCYDESQLPENMRSWLQHYIDEIKLLQQYNLTSPQKAIATVGEPIAKTTTCQWDQLAPYNYDCPMVTTYSDAACTVKRREPMHAVTGCPATALAQVLYVWKDEYAKPEVKEGKLKCAIPARVDVVAEAREIENKKKVPVWLKYTDEGIPASTTIDWANLTDLYSKRDSVGRNITDYVGGTPEQQAAVARLMHICGSLCKMQYGTVYTGGSASDELSVLSGAVKYLNFDHARLQQRFMYEYDEWIKRLYDELRVAKAVFFGGNSTEGGHAFVIDGYYKEDLFHVNWGWSGLADEAMENGGYYRINSLLPVNQGTGGAVVNDGFRLMQAFISGLYPNAQKPAEEPSISVSLLNTYVVNAMPPAVVTAKEGDEFTITGVLAADGLEVGRYTLFIGSPAEILISGHDFEVVDGGTDGIDTAALQEVTQDSNVWYDLQGRRFVGKPSVPGLYVNNGRKVLLK